MSEQETPPEPSLEEQIQHKCAEWQKRLRLADWDISVKLLPALEMENTRALGQVRWHLDERVADIRLVTPEDAGKLNGMRPYNVEETLIHELLHLHLAPFNPESEEKQTAQEFAINAIAGALLRMANGENQT